MMWLLSKTCSQSGMCSRIELDADHRHRPPMDLDDSRRLPREFDGFIDQQRVDGWDLPPALSRCLEGGGIGGAGQQRESDAGADSCPSGHHLRLFPLALLTAVSLVDLAVLLETPDRLPREPVRYR